MRKNAYGALCRAQLSKASTPKDPKKAPSELKDYKVVAEDGREDWAFADEGGDKDSSQGESEDSPNDSDNSEDGKGPGDTPSFGMVGDVAICQAVAKLKQDLPGVKLADGTRRHNEKAV